MKAKLSKKPDVPRTSPDIMHAMKLLFVRLFNGLNAMLRSENLISRPDTIYATIQLQNNIFYSTLLSLNLHG